MHPKIVLRSDELVYAAARGEVSVAEAARREMVSNTVIRRRAKELGLNFPTHFADTSRMGRPKGSFKSKWLEDETPIEEAAPLTVFSLSVEGKDLYLVRLRQVHVFPRSEVYPGSNPCKRERHLVAVA